MKNYEDEKFWQHDALEQNIFSLIFFLYTFNFSRIIPIPVLINSFYSEKHLNYNFFIN